MRGEKAEALFARRRGTRIVALNKSGSVCRGPATGDLLLAHGNLPPCQFINNWLLAGDDAVLCANSLLKATLFFREREAGELGEDRFSDRGLDRAIDLIRPIVPPCHSNI